MGVRTHLLIGSVAIVLGIILILLGGFLINVWFNWILGLIGFLLLPSGIVYVFGVWRFRKEMSKKQEIPTEQFLTMLATALILLGLHPLFALRSSSSIQFSLIAFFLPGIIVIFVILYLRFWKKRK